MGSSSEDSLPVIRRQVLDDINKKSAEKRERKRSAMLLDDGSSDESDLPSWLRNENNDKVEPGTQRDGATSGKTPNTSTKRDMRDGMESKSKSTARQQKPERIPTIFLLSSDSEDDLPLAQRKANIEMESLPLTQVDETATQPVTQPMQHTQSTQHHELTQEKTETPRPVKKSPVKKQRGQKIQKEKEKQADATPKNPSPGVAGKGGRKSVDVIVPDKLPGCKLIMELESSKEKIAGATDLSGDTGAIGRILQRVVAGPDGESTVECHELDLKGRVYNVTPVEFPGTIMVLNFTGEEAKVESVMDAFIQLRENSRFRSDENEEQMRAWLDEDNDDDQDLMTQGTGSVVKGAQARPRQKATGKLTAKKKKPVAKKRK